MPVLRHACLTAVALTFLAALILAALPTPGAPATTAPSSAPAAAAAVPDTLISQIQSQMVRPEDKLTDTSKLRRYRSVLRYGRQAEADFPQAANLYIVRGLMLEACRGLMVLQADDVTPDQVIDLARRIVAADPPPEWRISADLLLTQTELVDIIDDAKRTTPLIQAFIARYAETPLAPDALMHAINLAQEANLTKLVSSLGDQLDDLAGDDPRVITFLREQLGRVRLIDRSLSGTFKTLDGKMLRLPRDVMGKTVLVHFWTPSIPRCVAELSEVKDLYQKYRAQGLEIISFGFTPDADTLRKAVTENALTWPQVHATNKPDDPIVQMWGVKAVPAYWVVLCDGRFAWDVHDHDRHNRMTVAVSDGMDIAWRRQRCFQSMRTAQFLTHDILALLPSGDVSGGGAVGGTGGAMPPTVIDAITSKVHVAYLVTTDANQAPLHQQVLSLALKAEKDYPAAPQLPAVRALALISAEWLGQYDAAGPGNAQANGLAQRLLAQLPPEVPPTQPALDAATKPAETPVPILRILAQYARVRANLFDTDLPRQQVADRIAAFSKPYESTPAFTVVLPLRLALALEFGAEQMRGRYLDRPFRDSKGPPAIRTVLRAIYSPTLEHPATLDLNLTRLDGTRLHLPNDLRGKIVVVHFWTAEAPPGAPWTADFGHGRNTYGLLQPDKDLAIVGVNLDRSRAPAEAWARTHPDWVNTWSGLGDEDPAVLRYGLTALPATWVLDRDGRVFAAEDDPEMRAGFHCLETQFNGLLRNPPRDVTQWLKTVPSYTRIFSAADAIAVLHAAPAKPEHWLDDVCQPLARRVVQESLTFLDGDLRVQTARLLQSLGELNQGADGSWQPETARAAANTAIGAILRDRQQFGAVIQLFSGRAGIWLEPALLAQLRQAAGAGDCLGVSGDAEDQRRTLARFFDEQPAPTTIQGAGATPGAAATTQATPSRWFRLHPL